MTLIYKIATTAQWRDAVAAGVFAGAPVDLADGFIHFSSATQVAGTLERHFAGQVDLLVITLDADALGDALRWEPSRGGQLFPHLYAPLPVAAALEVQPIGVGADGQHVLPKLAAER